jgi:hypothetical protein
MAFRPLQTLGDLTVNVTQDRRTIGVAYKTVRFSPDEDVYIAFGDNTVAATVGSGVFIPGGSTELFTMDNTWTHYSIIGAVVTKVNVTWGENE